MRRTCRSKVACWSRTSTLILCVLTITACGQEPVVEKRRLVEYVYVKGTCKEDHVRDAPGFFGNYEGQVIHKYDVTHERHRISGRVILKLTDEEKQRRRERRRTDRYKYTPPRTVRFRQLEPHDIATDNFTLSGVSEYSMTETRDSALETTCQLYVRRRLDCWPSYVVVPSSFFEVISGTRIEYEEQQCEAGEDELSHPASAN